MNRRTARDYLMMRDGRNPYGSRGGYVESRRGRGGDYGYDGRRGDMARGSDMARGGDRAGSGDYARGGRGRDRAGDYQDYENDMARGGGRGRDRAGDYGYETEDFARGRGGRDGHYGRGEMYYPIEAMGYFNGYYGMGEEDYARGGRGRGGDRAGSDYGMDYEYDMARGGRRDYGDYAGDYGETLSKKEIEKWNKKLMKEVEEKDKQFFSKESISNKARNMGINFDKYNAEELAVATAMMYTDYNKALKPFVGANMDVYVKLADAFLNEDASVKGGEKLAVYHDCIVEDKEEDDD